MLPWCAWDVHVMGANVSCVGSSVCDYGEVHRSPNVVFTLCLHNFSQY